MKDLILEEYRKGNIVFATIEGIQTCPIEEFLKQPVEGMLYDLNRDEATILTSANEEGNVRWINDYALCKLVKHLLSHKELTLTLDKGEIKPAADGK